MIFTECVSGWNAIPCPVLYKSFDSTTGLTMMSGTLTTTIPLTTGKVLYVYNYSLQLCSIYIWMFMSVFMSVIDKHGHVLLELF